MAMLSPKPERPPFSPVNEHADNEQRRLARFFPGEGSNQPSSVHPIRVVAFQEEDAALDQHLTREDSEIQTVLDTLLEKCAFSIVQEKLNDLFADARIASDDGGYAGVLLTDMLSRNVETLQDGFIEALLGLFKQHNIKVSEKITLRLDEAGRLLPDARHSDAAKIAAVLAEEEVLTRAFTQIALQSAALRHLRALHILSAYTTPADAYAALIAGTSKQAYQLSVKGEMNHFYFTSL